MQEPIANMLTGGRLEIAKLQDTVIDIIYDTADPGALLYGGTAIWRCYEGGRFSEDIDIYMRLDSMERLERALARNGLSIAWRDPEAPTHARVSDGRSSVLLEASADSGESEMRQYFRVDGTSKMISVLTPAELLARKLEAYSARRYVRDIYDIAQLTNFLDKSDYSVGPRLRGFLKTIQKPDDEHVLSQLIYKGDRDVSFARMVEYLKRWAGEV